MGELRCVTEAGLCATRRVSGAGRERTTRCVVGAGLCTTRCVTGGSNALCHGGGPVRNALCHGGGPVRNASCHGGGSVKNTKEARKIVFDFEVSYQAKVRVAQWPAC